MEKGNLLADDTGKFNERRVEGINIAFGEIFKEAAESDKMIGLGDSLKIFAVLVFFAVELEAVFA